MDEEMVLGEDEPGGKEEGAKRLARILRLINLIGNGPRRWTRKRLAAHLEISERQLDKDFQLLRGTGYGLEHDPQGYWFSRAPELRAIRYTPAEALALLGALQMAQGSGLLDVASLGAALARTEEALPGAFLGLARSLRRRPGQPTARQRHRAEIHRLVETGLAERRAVVWSLWRLGRVYLRGYDPW